MMTNSCEGCRAYIPAKSTSQVPRVGACKLGVVLRPTSDGTGAEPDPTSRFICLRYLIEPEKPLPQPKERKRRRK